ARSLKPQPAFTRPSASRTGGFSRFADEVQKSGMSLDQIAVSVDIEDVLFAEMAEDAVDRLPGCADGAGKFLVGHRQADGDAAFRPAAVTLGQVEKEGED